MLDYYQISELFGPEERRVQATVREFLEAEAAPHVRDWWEEGVFPMDLPPRLGALGLLGANIPWSDGSQTVSNVSYGLTMYELERVDSGLRSFASVQGALVMYAIHAYGSDEMKRRYLPGLARGEIIGCFGLTEHEGGSDPSAMSMRAVRDGEDYVLNGAKMWISNGSVADIAIIWARDDEGRGAGLRGAVNYGWLQGEPDQAQDEPAGRGHQRAGPGGRASSGVDHLLPGARGLSAPLSCLTQARYGHRVGGVGGPGVGILGGARFRREPSHLRQAHRFAPARPGQTGGHALRPHPWFATSLAAGQSSRTEVSSTIRRCR